MKIIGSKKRGFTLSEMIVTIFLVSIISLVLAVMVVRGFQSYRISKLIISMQDEAARAMRDFEKVARGATEVLSSEPEEFVFYAYLAGDEYPAPSQVRYYMDGSTLMRGLIPPSGEGPIFNYLEEDEEFRQVAENVINGDLLFKYYNDASGLVEEPVPIDAVRMVEITISIDEDQTILPEPIVEITSVNLRNLKTNL